MSPSTTGRTGRLSALALAAVAAPILISSPASAASPLGSCAGATQSGTTITLNSDCATSAQIVVPNGTTIDGNGYTITAVDPDSSTTFSGAVLRSAAGTPTTPATLNVKNLTIIGALRQSNPGSLSGIYFDDAGGSISNVVVRGITTSSGSQAGRAIEVRNAAATTAPTLAINGLTLRGYNKSGVIIYGKTSFTATNMDIGPAGNIDGTQFVAGATNGFTVVGGGTGSITNSTISGNRYAVDDASPTAESQSAAILLINAPGVTVSGVKIVGTDSDTGLIVQDSSASPASNVRVTCTSFTRTNGGNADPKQGQALVNDTAAFPSTLTAGSNTFAGWTTNTSGPITATTDATCAPAVVPAAAVVSIRSNKLRPHKGKKFAIRGLASPALAGVMVTLEQRFGKKGYLPVASSTLPANGQIAFTRKATSRGNKYFHVVVGTGPAYAGGVSNRVKVQVR